MEPVLYEDKPHYDIWFKAILLFPLVVMVIPAYFLISSDPETAIGLLGTAVLIAVIYWAVMPRKYCILDNKVKVIMGKPFSFSISFDNIETARVPKATAIGINFVTSFKNSVEIVRKKGMNINISPSNRELFLDNFAKALNKWKERLTDLT